MTICINPSLSITWLGQSSDYTLQQLYFSSGRTIGQAFSDCLFHPERLDQYNYQLRTCIRDQVSHTWCAIQSRSHHQVVT